VTFTGKNVTDTGSKCDIYRMKKVLDVTFTGKVRRIQDEMKGVRLRDGGNKA